MNIDSFFHGTLYVYPIKKKKRDRERNDNKTPSFSSGFLPVSAPRVFGLGLSESFVLHDSIGLVVSNTFAVQKLKILKV